MVNNKYLNFIYDNLDRFTFIQNSKIYISIDILIKGESIDIKIYNKINDNFGYIYDNFYKKFDKKLLNKSTGTNISTYVKKYIVAKNLEKKIASHNSNLFNIFKKIPTVFHNSFYYPGFEFDNTLIPLYEIYKNKFSAIIPLYLKVIINKNNSIKKEAIDLLIVFKNNHVYIYLFEILDEYFDDKIYGVLLDKISKHINMLLENSLLYNEYKKLKFAGIINNDNIKIENKKLSHRLIRYYENYFSMFYLLINNNFNPNEISHFFENNITEYFIKYLNFIQNL
jgi:hypothetical protein